MFNTQQVNTCDASIGMGLIKKPSYSEALKGRRDELVKQLAEVNEAIDAIESNPEVKRTLDAVLRVGHIY